MSRLGLDYAWTQISPAAHKAVGSSFAARYLSTDPTKNLSPAEAHELRSNGIDVVVVWETTANRSLQGQAAGIWDAQHALEQAAWCGMPGGRPIYFAVDFDATPGDQAAINNYFHGVNSVLGVRRSGCYGGYWPITRLFNAGLIGYGWQTYAWSGGNVDGRAQLYQYSNGHRVAGQDCDFNRALKDDFGQWGYAAKPAGKPQPKRASGRFSVRLDYYHDEQKVELSPLDGQVKSWGDVDEWIRLEADLHVGPNKPGEWRGKVLGT